jgi:hypothetical protein
VKTALGEKSLLCILHLAPDCRSYPEMILLKKGNTFFIGKSSVNGPWFRYVNNPKFYISVDYSENFVNDFPTEISQFP